MGMRHMIARTNTASLFVWFEFDIRCSFFDTSTVIVVKINSVYVIIRL